MFRYQDEDNYYRFSMRRGRPRPASHRVVNGVPVDLWQDGVGYELGRSYQLTLRLAGPELTGYLDGAQLFSVSDESFSERTGRALLLGESQARVSNASLR